jgi:hypothetical protein
MAKYDYENNMFIFAPVKYFIWPDWCLGTEGLKLFEKKQCEVSNCFLSNNRYHLNQIYLLIKHYPSALQSMPIRGIGKKRSIPWPGCC